MTLRGTLERRELEGGTWILVTPTGAWVLLGQVPAGLEGKPVEVDGDEDEGFGLFMQGRQLQVRAVRPQ
ncbi:MAG: hypothetical protein EXR69_03580 [Myxococcales bacterium]|nr:hypothetical protein [Myxococcales bacterium]